MIETETSASAAASGTAITITDPPLGRWKRWRRSMRDLIYRLRTEGDTPIRQAAAVALGIFVGCSPFYGLHLPMCIVLARLLGLNRFKTYIAAHISLPIFLPFLIYAEVRVGRWLRGARPVPISAIEKRHPVDFQHVLDLLKQLRHPWSLGSFAIDLLMGSVIVGAGLALFFGLLTYAILRRGHRTPEVERLIGETSVRYLESGMFHWDFVRGKLRHDPIYFDLLRSATLPPEGRLLDLGCGRGILMALLVSARGEVAAETYPADWPTPPVFTYHGIDGRSRVAAVARQALGAEATIETADLCALEPDQLPSADVVVLFDVLHYLSAKEQEILLGRAVGALAPGGLLLLREADARAGLRFYSIRTAERLSALLRRDLRQRFSYRSATDWKRLLEKLGLTIETAPAGHGTSCANVLIRARRAAESQRGPGDRSGG